LSGGVIGIVSGGVQSSVGSVGGSLAAAWQRVLGRDLSEFPFSLLQLVALPFVLERGLRGRAFSDRVVAAATLLTLPLLVAQLWLGLRAGQSFIVLLLGCLASARLISLPLGWRWSPWLRRAATALALLIAVQVELQVGLAKLVDQEGNEIGTTLAFAWMTNPARRFAVRGWDNPTVSHAGRWIRANVPAGEGIMSDWHWSDSLYVAIGGDRPLLRLPVIASRSLSHSALDARRKPSYDGSAQPILFVWSQAGRQDPANPEAWLNALSEPQLLAALREFQIRWLVVTQRRNFITEYLDASPSFARAVLFGDDDIVIYSVHPRPQPIAFETRLRLGAAAYLLRLREEQPARFEQMRRRFLEQRLGFGPDAIESMLGDAK
jgi:hypothetical protein